MLFEVSGQIFKLHWLKHHSFFLFFFPTVLTQATNAHTNEVVAVKKMSYSGKQTHEVS